MTSTMMVERTGQVLPGYGTPSTGAATYGTPTGFSANMMMVPRVHCGSRSVRAA